VEDAVTVLAQPKQFGRRRAAPAPPLRELGNDPVSGQPVVVKDGRFGPYVTDGETNASLRKGDTVEAVTIERAAELLQIRRDAGPAKKRGAKKAPAKKAAKKTTAKKATAKKATAKKATAKKATAEKTAAPPAAPAPEEPGEG
jgi:DNA topoisomerase-1